MIRNYLKIAIRNLLKHRFISFINLFGLTIGLTCCLLITTYILNELGATVRQLLLLISKEFLKLVLVAFVIAVPLTWWFMNNWLEKYTYRVTISIWIFGAVGIVVLLLTLVVVSLNTLRAAIANPVKSLRTE